MFFSILTTDDKYSLLNRDNLGKKNFSHFVAAFSKVRLNFEYFQEKDDPHS